jgi:hypothetical protein
VASDQADLPSPHGTLAELLPISERVLAFVAHERKPGTPVRMDRIPSDDLRRIELMALAVREACFRNLLYPEPTPSEPTPPETERLSLPDEDLTVLMENLPAPFNPLKGATCDDCGAPATWWMDNMSSYMVFGCDAHRPYQQTEGA